MVIKISQCFILLRRSEISPNDCYHILYHQPPTQPLFTIDKLTSNFIHLKSPILLFLGSIKQPLKFLDVMVPFLVWLGPDSDDINTMFPNWVKVPYPLSPNAQTSLENYRDSAVMQHPVNQELKWGIEKLAKGKQSLQLPNYSNVLAPWIEDKVKKLILIIKFEVGLQALFVFGWFYTRIDSEDNAGS